MEYAPPAEILIKYAKVLVNFALGDGKGMKSGDVVYLQSPLSALPLYRAVAREIVNSGGMTISSLSDDMSGFGRYYYEHASEKQLSTFLSKYSKGLVEQIDHRIALLADYDVHELESVDPKKIMLSQRTSKPLVEWLDAKENDGRYTWTLALYGTPAMAAEAGLTEKVYWDQIIKACYLDKSNPIASWKAVDKEVKRVVATLTNLDIKRVHITGKDIDLYIDLGDKRRWLGGGGRNIPSFEVFTSPDWRGVEGWIRFNQPLYHYGSMVRGIELHFEKGRVVSAKAEQNEKLLTEMLATDTGASQVGEFSLTDKRLSHITKFMAETLYDENMGGKYGNTHIAVGKSFHDAYLTGPKGVSSSTFKKLGFNESAIHTDMISTADRIVRAWRTNGEEQVIYKDGQFTI